MTEPRHPTLTHFDARGQAHMVDVAEKRATLRRARAVGRITMQPQTFALIHEGQSQKGDVLGVARIAAIQAAKKTSELIPLCHPLALTRVAVTFSPEPQMNAEGRLAWACEVVAETLGVTGVEMEALTGVQVALLTIYDMCKAVDKAMVMTDIHLVEKTGGKSGEYRAA